MTHHIYELFNDLIANPLSKHSYRRLEHYYNGDKSELFRYVIAERFDANHPDSDQEQRSNDQEMS